MRMAQINLPASDNHGNELWKENGYLMRRLADVFGGYTRTLGVGGWMSPEGVIQENVYVYQVAMVNTDVNCEKLRQLARNVGEMAEQQAMFIMLPSGEVEIIDIV